MKKWGRVVIVATVLAGAATATKVGMMARNIGGNAGVGATWAGLTNPRGQFPGKDRVNILLIGKDYNHTNKGILYTKQARSDTLIMLSLDLENQKVSALSIPRDTYIPSRRGKINAAYTQGGAKLAMKTVGDLLGVAPDYYIALKPDAVKEIVDLLGGVEVEALDRMKYDDNWGGLHIDLPKGRYTVNGDQAVGFVRFRNSNPGEPPSLERTDERRMARQQQMLKAMAAKAKTPPMLLHADALIDAALRSVETPLTRPQLLAIATLFRSAQPEQMQTASLIGNVSGRVGKLSVFLPDERKTDALVDWLLKGDPTAAYRLTTVAVQNGTGIPGVARQVTDLLRERGFDAKNAGNAARRGDTAELPETRIVYGKAAIQERAAHIATLLGGGKLVKEPLPAGATVQPDLPDVTIVVGRDVAASFAPRSANR